MTTYHNSWEKKNKPKNNKSKVFFLLEESIFSLQEKLTSKTYSYNLKKKYKQKRELVDTFPPTLEASRGVVSTKLYLYIRFTIDCIKQKNEQTLVRA